MNSFILVRKVSVLIIAINLSLGVGLNGSSVKMLHAEDMTVSVGETYIPADTPENITDYTEGWAEEIPQENTSPLTAVDEAPATPEQEDETMPSRELLAESLGITSDETEPTETNEGDVPKTVGDAYDIVIVGSPGEVPYYDSSLSLWSERLIGLTDVVTHGLIGFGDIDFYDKALDTVLDHLEDGAETFEEAVAYLVAPELEIVRNGNFTDIVGMLFEEQPEFYTNLDSNSTEDAVDVDHETAVVMIVGPDPNELYDMMPFYEERFGDLVGDENVTMTTHMPVLTAIANIADRIESGDITADDMIFVIAMDGSIGGHGGDDPDYLMDWQNWHSSDDTTVPITVERVLDAIQELEDDYNIDIGVILEGNNNSDDLTHSLDAP